MKLHVLGLMAMAIPLLIATSVRAMAVQRDANDVYTFQFDSLLIPGQDLPDLFFHVPSDNSYPPMISLIEEGTSTSEEVGRKLKDMFGDGLAMDNNKPKRGGGRGKKGKISSYVLPLASPMNKPEVTYIPPWSYGSEQWDPVAGAAGTFGPHGDFRSSQLQPGQTVPFPPGTSPDMNPNMYIQPAPTGVQPSQLQIEEDVVVNRANVPTTVGPQGTVNGVDVFPNRLRSSMVDPDQPTLPPEGVPLGAA